MSLNFALRKRDAVTGFGFNPKVNGCQAVEGTAPLLKAIGQCLATCLPVQDQNLKLCYSTPCRGCLPHSELTATSTRRFLARPSAVSLLAMGLPSPYHMTATRPASNLKFFIR